MISSEALPSPQKEGLFSAESKPILAINAYFKKLANIFKKALLQIHHVAMIFYAINLIISKMSMKIISLILQEVCGSVDPFFLFFPNKRDH